MNVAGDVNEDFVDMLSALTDISRAEPATASLDGNTHERTATLGCRR